MAILNELKARLGLDTAAFARGIKGVQAETLSMSQRMRKALLPAATAMTAMTKGLALAIKGQLDNADEMAKAAQKFGVPVEELSRLKYAADLSDVSLETLGAGLRGLSKNLSAAFDGNKGATKLFTDLGVEITDATGKLRPTESVMQDISDVIAKMPDGAKKTALAMKLFGKSGAEMIPMLNSGKDAMRQMADEANAMGIVIDEKTGTAAQNFNDNITRIQTAVGGLVVQLAAALAPALESISGYVVDLTKWFQDLSPRAKEIAAGVTVVVAALGPLGLGFLAVTSAVGMVVSALRGMALALLANPVIAIIAAIAAGAYLIYQNWGAITAWFAGLWEQIKAGIAIAWEGIKNYLANYTAAGLIYTHWDDITTWFSDKFRQVKENIAFYWELIKVDAALAWTWVSDRWNASVAWFSGLWGRIKTAFTDGWQKIKDVTAQWVADFLAIGGQIVDGLKQGITDKWDAMVQWFSDKANELSDSVREAFGIQSPSRIFRAIGQFITQGLGLGIKDNVPMVKDAMEGVAGTIDGEAGSLTSGITSFRDSARSAFQSVITGAQSAGQAVRQFMQNWLSSTANNLAGGAFDTLLSVLGFANGGVFSGGRVQAFADGGVVGSPTYFGMSGRVGLMGEAGPEAIMPLSRGSDGKLGVRGGGQALSVSIGFDNSAGGFTALVRNEAGQVLAQAAPAIVSQSVQQVSRAMSKTKSFGN